LAKQVRRKNLPDADRVARRCGNQRLITDPETGAVCGIIPQALRLRTEQNEKYLSTSWFEFHNGSDWDRLKEILAVYRGGGDNPGPNSAIALLEVGKIIAAGAARSHAIRVTHRPNSRDPAYTPVEGLPLDNSDQLLLEMLCSGACVGVHRVSDIDAA
jgi:hypothetical protein